MLIEGSTLNVIGFLFKLGSDRSVNCLIRCHVRVCPRDWRVMAQRLLSLRWGDHFTWFTTDPF